MCQVVPGCRCTMLTLLHTWVHTSLVNTTSTSPDTRLQLSLLQSLLARNLRTMSTEEYPTTTSTLPLLFQPRSSSQTSEVEVAEDPVEVVMT